MTLEEFCHKLEPLELEHWQQALAILWYHDEKQPDVSMSAGELAKIIHETGLGVPHSTRLGEAIRTCRLVLGTPKGFRLKPLSRPKIREWFAAVLGAPKPQVDQELGYLPREVWEHTRGYIEKVCEQLNGCYQFGFFDGASVMVRRLAETLVLESYETLKREVEIKDGQGNYYMLRDLVSRANGNNGLNLGRNSKTALEQIKEVGDLSAHNRRYNAKKADLDKIRMGVRVLAEELINVAKLKPTAAVPQS